MSAKFRRIGLFSNGSEDHIDEVTVQMCRNMFTFIWICVMGLTHVAPNEELLMHICIFGKEINIQLSGINMAYREIVLDEEQVDKLQSVCHKLGEGIVE